MLIGVTEARPVMILLVVDVGGLAASRVPCAVNGLLLLLARRRHAFDLVVRASRDPPDSTELAALRAAAARESRRSSHVMPCGGGPRLGGSASTCSRGRPGRPRVQRLTPGDLETASRLAVSETSDEIVTATACGQPERGSWARAGLSSRRSTDRDGVNEGRVADGGLEKGNGGGGGSMLAVDGATGWRETSPRLGAPRVSSRSEARRIVFVSARLNEARAAASATGGLTVCWSLKPRAPC